MRKRLFILTLLSTTALSFASPISTPNNVNDTPIVSNGGGTVSGSGQCQAYQSDGAVVNLSGVSRVTFYGSGSYGNNGGYLSTAITQQSGTGFIKRVGGDGKVGTYTYSQSLPNPLCYLYGLACFGVYQTYSYEYPYYSPGTAIGLFLNNTTNQSDFIAGAGGGGGSCETGEFYWVEEFYQKSEYDDSVRDTLNRRDYWITGGNGGGWEGEGIKGKNGGSWFAMNGGAGVGFYGGVPYYNTLTYATGTQQIRIPAGSGGTSSISAFYNIPTNKYTSPGSTFTIFGGGYSLDDTATAYVCR